MSPVQSVTDVPVHSPQEGLISLLGAEHMRSHFVVAVAMGPALRAGTRSLRNSLQETDSASARIRTVACRRLKRDSCMAQLKNGHTLSRRTYSLRFDVDRPCLITFCVNDRSCWRTVANISCDSSSSLTTRARLIPPDCGRQNENGLRAPRNRILLRQSAFREGQTALYPLCLERTDTGARILYVADQRRHQQRSVEF
jgi:hypothetical protein